MADRYLPRAGVRARTGPRSVTTHWTRDASVALLAVDETGTARLTINELPDQRRGVSVGIWLEPETIGRMFRAAMANPIAAVRIGAVLNGDDET